MSRNTQFNADELAFKNSYHVFIVDFEILRIPEDDQQIFFKIINVTAIAESINTYRYHKDSAKS